MVEGVAGGFEGVDEEWGRGGVVELLFYYQEGNVQTTDQRTRQELSN